MCYLSVRFHFSKVFAIIKLSREVGTVRYSILLGTKTGQAGKGDTMDEIMTDFQFKKILEMVYNIVDRCESIEEVKQALKALIDDGKTTE